MMTSDSISANVPLGTCSVSEVIAFSGAGSGLALVWVWVWSGSGSWSFLVEGGFPYRAEALLHITTYPYLHFLLDPLGSFLVFLFSSEF